jgi:PKD repeat protein
MNKTAALMFLILSLICQKTFSQNTAFLKENIYETLPNRIVDDLQPNMVVVNYQFTGVCANNIEHQKQNYQSFSIKGFGYTEDVGKPMLPVRYDMFLIPEKANINIEIIEANYIEFTSKTIFPAFRPLTDDKNDSLVFEMDQVFYTINQFSPEEIIQIESRGKMHELSFVRIKTLPLQYNPVTKTVRFYTNIKYRLDFGENIEENTNISPSDPIIELASRWFVNTNHVKINTPNKAYGLDSLDYLIVTQDDYLLAADSLSQWRNQMGYTTKIVSKDIWTSQEVNDSIHYYYQNYSPPPDYFVILGSHDDVPAKEINTTGSFVSDLYYACMDSINDFHPDIFRGRISVSSIDEALGVVRKLILYEKEPIINNLFYNTALNCAQFQDDEPDGYANRRFTHTSEEARDYLMSLGYKVNRVYTTGSMIDPQYFNNGYYSNGQPIPAALLRSNGYQWDGNYQNIVDSINEGRFLVLHRDHGFTGGWGSPNFTTAHLDLLNNKDKYPLVFSLNCSSGCFSASESFAEKILRLPKSGAMGVIAAAYTSYSGYNDAFAIGLYDAIWSNPGANPVFGTAGNPSPNPTIHNDIHEGGCILDHGLIRTIETFADFETHFQLFHYYGDPALKVWTEQPQIIIAIVQDTILCGDTLIQIFSSSCLDGLATICVNGVLLGKTNLVAGVGTIYFDSIINWSAEAVVTISKINHKPFIQNIPIVGCTNSPQAEFIVDKTELGLCNNNIVHLSDQSLYVPTQWKWEILPSTYQFIQNTTDTTQHPMVAFTAVGNYNIKLIVSNAYGVDSISYLNVVTVNAPLSIGYSQDFESCDHTMSCLLSQDWEVSTESYKWRIYNDSTPSFSTGPIVDHTLGTNQGMYIYTEASSGANLDTAQFIIPCIDLSGVQVPVLTFWYHMYGNNIYKLSIDVYSSAQWHNNIHTITGHQQTTYMDAWEQAFVDLTAFASETIKIRFTAIRGDGYQGDLAIDDIGIDAYTQSPNVAFYAEDTYSCCDFLVQFVDSCCCGITSRQWSFPGGTPSFSTLTNPIISYANSGNYNVKLVTTNVFGIDSITKTSLIHIGQNYASPNSENFENFTSGNPGTFLNGWETYQSHDFNWRVNNGGTPSGNTGPLYDHTLGNVSGKYIYSESSYVSRGEEAILYSPCFSVDSSSNVLGFSFWYHMYGSYIDTLYVELNRGDGWQLISFLNGSQQLNQNDPWKQLSVDISPYISPQLKFRFRSIHGASYMEDVGIDDVNIDTLIANKCEIVETSILFDTLAINGLQVKSFYIYNKGMGMLYVDSIGINAPFSITSLVPFSILPNDSAEVLVQFNPQIDGLYLDTVYLFSNQDLCEIAVNGICDNIQSINNDEYQFVIYPNPANNKLYLLLNKEAEIQIFDLRGSLVYQANKSKTYTINTIDWNSGIYYIRIFSEGKIQTARCVVLH